MAIDQAKQDRTKTSTPLAAGSYWVGDPCYAFTSDEAKDHSVWMAWLDDAWSETDPNRVQILDGRVRGARIVASRTAHGDGEYPDQFGNSYPVDAGLLGAVHASHWVVGTKPDGMVLHEFPEPFHVEWSEETGTVTIGHVEIETDQSPWDEEDEEF